ncbi:MAG: multimeric flavodoxin WrbA [Candidatus Azotimanducaceae bacterium]
MKNLLIVYHSQTGNTEQMAEAVLAGANDSAIDGVEVRLLQAKDASADDLLWANGLILGTPENFGYMSGALKGFFDRTFYAVEGKIAPLPYSVFISAGNDGSGALRSIERIANGYPFVSVQAAIICKGTPTSVELSNCKELGQALATGLELGIF